MKALHNILENPLLREMHARQRAELRERFPELTHCSHRHFLALRKYLTRSPERFFSEPVYLKFLAWLKERDRVARRALQRYLGGSVQELNRAFLHLGEINCEDWHDYFEKLDDYELIRFIDQHIHRTYLRLAEAVLAPFLRIPAYFSRVDHGKGTEGLDIWCIVEELRRTDLCDAVAPYRHTVRNGIAHGGVTYLQKEIRYRDKKGNEEKYEDSEIVRIFDDLLDTCNGLALALSVFLLTNQPHGYELPRQLLVQELREETKTPWWEIVGCAPSEFAGLNQLILYARPRTSDYRKVQLSAFQSGVLAELFAPGYDRYFFSIRSATSWPGWAAFDGKRLRQLRLKPDASLEDYDGVIENNLVFYVPRLKLPAILGRLDTLALSLRLHWPIVMADLRKQLGLLVVCVREAKIHRRNWGCVLNASVYVRSPNRELSQDRIRRSCGRIVRKALADACRRASAMEVSRYLPLGFARVAVFRRDYRRRRLASFGLGADLVGTIQVQRTRRIRCPDIMGSTVEQKGKYRIAWNRAWIEDTVDL